MAKLKEMVEILFGLLFWVILLYALSFGSWLNALVKFVQGGVLVGLFFIGLGLIALGVMELKE